MLLRLALVAPLALAAVLPAQLKPLTPPPKAAEGTQGPSPKEQISKLTKDKAQLTREIQYAQKRVQEAKKLLSIKMRRAKPSFRVIDAGKPASAMPIAAKRTERKYARIGTTDEMNYGGQIPMVIVNDRAISQAAFDGVMDYLHESQSPGDKSMHAQKVLSDMIRIEGTASQFIENDGEVQLSENLALLESGKKSFADAAKEFGSVRGATAEGVVEVTRNSMLGPYFEYVAFSTPAGKTSRPFRNREGYVLIKVNSIEQGATTQLSKAKCQVVLFSYTKNEKVMQDAQFQVNAGQIDIKVRDQGVMDMLPALFKRPQPQMTPQQSMQKELTVLESRLQKVIAKLGAESKEAQQLQGQIQILRKRMVQQTPQDAVDAPSDADKSKAPVKKKLTAPKKKGGK